MTRRISGVTPVSGEDRRTADRRERDRRAASASRDLVPIEPTPEGEPRPAPAPPAEAGASGFAAQMIGQSGQRRGLKGGPPVMDAARSTYLGAEFSGGSERRPKPGRAKDTDV